MYSDLDIVYAYITDSANYSRQSYQKMVEKSIENEIGEQHDERRDKRGAGSDIKLGDGQL